MNRLERMTAILLFLQEKPRTAREIAARFEVSRRTVLRDVQALSEMGVPVIARDGAAGGYELPADYSLAPLALSSREAFLLLLALDGINRPTDMPFGAERASLQAKLRALLPAAQVEGLQSMLSAIRLDGEAREQRAPFLEALFEALQQGRWVRAAYRSAERESIQHIYPRHISKENGLWYCRAFTLEREDERLYRVDRFTDVSSAPDELQGVQPPPNQPYAQSGDPLVEVRLTSRGAARLESEPHLGAMLQREPTAQNRLAFNAPIPELDYYARLFISLGSDVTVIGPPLLRQKIADLARQALANYPE
jgi:predicted DNA-binding transcriptional regulator YafY